MEKQNPLKGFKFTKKEEPKKEVESNEPKNEDNFKAALNEMDKKNSENPKEEKAVETETESGNPEFEEAMKLEIRKNEKIIDEMIEATESSKDDKAKIGKMLQSKWNDEQIKEGKHSVKFEDIFFKETKIYFKFINDTAESAIKVYDFNNNKSLYFLKNDCVKILKKMGIDNKMFISPKEAIAFFLSAIKQHEIYLEIEVEVKEGKEAKYAQVTILE